MLPQAVSKALLRSHLPLRLPVQTRPFHTSKLTHFYSIPRLAPPARLPLIAARGAASSVSNKPGSQTLPHAAQNIREETGNSATDLAKTIAGNVSLSQSKEPGGESFLGITSLIASTVPSHILNMGLAGALPYVVTSMSSAYFAHQAGMAANGLLTSLDPAVAMTLLQDCLHIQVTYGAVLLSFAGALHWGMEMAGYNGQKGYPRLMLGAVPVMYAWSTLALDPVNALMAQWLGFTGLWWADMRATSAGWTPKWYSQYRFYLSVLVGTCIIGTLAATSYYGPSPGHDAVAHRIDVIRNERRQAHGDFSNEVRGPIGAVPAGENADGYVKIVRKPEQSNEESNEGSK
ncbi:hypothetical protein M422DRAFT_168276 [Sphaerobolus stellatus SS14]|uniref:Uncharacterized protein n=1 Tax=Sphaerobolus stellatus (strain SS14) TaxID=990650 RepID=A0A0C9VBF4_SPHS4|nr:hypothetical protein M422DRAFT_168276 [Sphaerobolus stellatus SS14]